MKHNLLCFFLFMFPFLTKAQHGLENVLVEKYYVADVNDEKGSNGQLPAGSVTYRIFIDMRPGYRFQAVYGIQGHPLSITTSTHFFNNTIFGASLANDILGKNLIKGTTMLDSWLSVGAAAENHFALPKEADSTRAGVNADGLLLSENPEAGIPLKQHDGMLLAVPLPVPTLFGIDSLQLSIFNSNTTHLKGQTFFTENGSWACFGGSIGCDSSNRVLIAQLTTDGTLSFELNIQLGTPFGGTENYVAKNPSGEEIRYEGLRFPDVNERKNSQRAPGK